MCQMSFRVCAAQIFPLDMLLFVFLPSALLHTNHIFHLTGSVCTLQHSIQDDLQHHQTSNISQVYSIV